MSSVAVLGLGSRLGSNVDPLMTGCLDNSLNGCYGAVLALVVGGVTVFGAGCGNSGNYVLEVKCMSFLRSHDHIVADAAVQTLGAVIESFVYTVTLGCDGRIADGADIGVTAGVGLDLGGRRVLRSCLHGNTADLAGAVKASSLSVGDVLFAGDEVAARAGPAVSIGSDNSFRGLEVVTKSFTGLIAAGVLHDKTAGLAVVVGKAILLCIAYSLVKLELVADCAVSVVVLIHGALIRVGNLAILGVLVAPTPRGVGVLTGGFVNSPCLVGPAAFASLVSSVTVSAAGCILFGNVLKGMSSLGAVNDFAARLADFVVLGIILDPSVTAGVSSGSGNGESANLADAVSQAGSAVGIDPLTVLVDLVCMNIEVVGSDAALNGAVLPMLIGARLVVFAPLMGIGGLVDLAGLGSLADRAGACFNTVSLAGRSSGNLPCAPLVTGLRNGCSTFLILAGVGDTVDNDSAIALVAGGGSVLGAGGSLSCDSYALMRIISGKLSTASYASDAVSALEGVGVEAIGKDMVVLNHFAADLAGCRGQAESGSVKLMSLGSDILLVDDIAALGADVLLLALFGAGCSSNNNGLIGVTLSIVLCAANVAGSSAEELVGGLAAYIVISTVGVTDGSLDGFVAAFTQALAGVAGRSSLVNKVTESSNDFGSVDNLGSLGIAEHGLAGLAGPVFLQTGSNAGSRLLGSVYEVMSKLRSDNVIADGAGNSFGAGSLCVLVIDMGSSGISLYGAADLAGAPVGCRVGIYLVIMCSRAVGAGRSKNSAADGAVVMVDTGFAAGSSLYKQILDLQASGELGIGLTVVNGKSVRPCNGGSKLLVCVAFGGSAASAALVVFLGHVADGNIDQILGINLLYGVGVISVTGLEGIGKGSAALGAAHIICAGGNALTGSLEVLRSNDLVVGMSLYGVGILHTGSSANAGTGGGAVGTGIVAVLGFRNAVCYFNVCAGAGDQYISDFVACVCSTGSNADTKYCSQQQSYGKQYLSYAFERMYGLGIRMIRN